MRYRLLILIGLLLSLATLTPCATAVSANETTAATTPSDSVNPNHTAEEKIWKRHQDLVFQALTASANPRDWALAAIVETSGLDANGQRERAALIERAANAAPDDALVQWIALLQRDAKYASPTDVDSLQVLQRLEPDNATVWLETLDRAALRKDTAAIDAALDRMAASTRVNAHNVDLMKALVAIYQQYPVPAEYSALVNASEHPYMTPDAWPYAAAIIVSVAIALPSYEHLVRACRVNPATGQNLWRQDDCASIGRLLAARGSTMIDNRIGFSLLRISHTFNDQDIANARALDWIWTGQGISLIDKSVPDMIARTIDWMNTGSEIGSIRRAVVRNGGTLLPPADWVDKGSPFSEQRFKNDARYATERAEQPF